MWGQAARAEAQAYDAIAAYEARLALFNRANSAGRLAQHLAVLDRLEQAMTMKITRADAFRNLAEQADGPAPKTGRAALNGHFAEFGLIERSTGEVRDPNRATHGPAAGHLRLQALGQQFKQWPGLIYEKLGGYFCNLAPSGPGHPAAGVLRGHGLFSYVPMLQRALQPLEATRCGVVERWGAPGIQSLSRLWQFEADARRHPRSALESQRLNLLWAACFDQAVLALGDQLWLAWDTLSAILGKVWRGSSLAESINSKLRPLLDRRDQTESGPAPKTGREASRGHQGCLALFQFLHNTRIFARDTPLRGCGKRAGHSPALLLHLDVPDDPLTLLGFAPKCQSNSPAF